MMHFLDKRDSDPGDGGRGGGRGTGDGGRGVGELPCEKVVSFRGLIKFKPHPDWSPKGFDSHFPANIPELVTSESSSRAQTLESFNVVN